MEFRFTMINGNTNNCIDDYNISLIDCCKLLINVINSFKTSFSLHISELK